MSPPQSDPMVAARKSIREWVHNDPLELRNFQNMMGGKIQFPSSRNGLMDAYIEFLLWMCKPVEQPNQDVAETVAAYIHWRIEANQADYWHNQDMANIFAAYIHWKQTYPSQVPNLQLAIRRENDSIANGFTGEVEDAVSLPVKNVNYLKKGNKGG